jgi:hypothetical protein
MLNFSSYRYLAIVVLMTAESACIPIPSELTMPFGGALAAGAVAGVRDRSDHRRYHAATEAVVNPHKVSGRTCVRGPK